MKTPLESAFKVAFGYAAAAAVWILASDALLGSSNGEWSELVSILKGLAFVAVTSTILFFLVARFTRGIADEAMRAESTERVLTQVVRTVPVGVVLCSDETEITYLNPAAEELFDLTSDRAVGLAFSALCCGDPETAKVRSAELFGTGAVDSLLLAPRDSEKPRAVLARAAAIEPGATGSGWVVALADVSDAQADVRTAQEAARAYRFLSEALVMCERATDATSLLIQIAELAKSTKSFSAVWTCSRDEGDHQLVPIVSDGLGPAGQEAASLLLRRVNGGSGDALLGLLATGQAYVVNDVQRDPSSPWYTAAATEHIGSVVMIGFADSRGLAACLALFTAEPGFFDAMRMGVVSAVQESLTFSLERLAINSRRLEAEEALEESEEGYRLLFEKHPLPLWIYDVHSLAFLAVNDAAIAKYGFSESKFKSMTIADIRPPQDVSRLVDNVHHVSEGFDDAGMWTHIDSKGREFPVHIYSHTIRWEGHDAEMVMALEVALVT